MEHFCTLFDSNFLPQGLSLYRSLEKHAGDFHLWILCMDKQVEEQLKTLQLKNVSMLSLHEIENQELLRVKASRSAVEYFWTLSPFLPNFILNHSPELKRITYLDADLFFFDSPEKLLQELDQSGKQALITEHAYAPEYNQTEKSGRFCVQFVSFTNTEKAKNILKWWQDRCIEWCFARHEDGKFGDQKYLDQWPSLFPDAVCVLENKTLTLAPWNVKFYLQQSPGLKPVFFHFHGLRIYPSSIRLFSGYSIGKRAEKFYQIYVNELKESMAGMAKNCLKLSVMQPNYTFLDKLRILKRTLLGREKFLPL